MQRWSCTTHSEAGTRELGRRVAAVVHPPFAIGLSGTLGAGKTRFVQGLVEGLGGEQLRVTSPTFSLWQTYPCDPPVHHLDVYRIRDEDEFQELGVDEWFEPPSIVVVEWADRFPDLLPEDSLQLTVEVTGETERWWEFTAKGPISAACLDQLAASD